MQGVSLPSTSTTHSESDIIDLTLDSDDEDPAPPPPPPRPVEKRKILENTNPSPPGQAWKKVRLDSSVPLTVARNINGNVNVISGAGSSHSNDTGGTSVPSALRMLHFDPLRDAQRAQTSVFPSRPPIPVLPPTARPPSSVIRPPDLPTTPYRSPYRAAPQSNSPPPPPGLNQYTRTSSGSTLSTAPLSLSPSFGREWLYFSMV